MSYKKKSFPNCGRINVSVEGRVENVCDKVIPRKLFDSGWDVSPRELELCVSLTGHTSRM